MKTPISIILFLFLFVSYTEAQIRTSSSVVIEPEIIVAEYDSTANSLGENPFGYIGQQLYLRGNNEKSDYSDFLIDYEVSSWKSSNIYKPNRWGNRSSYEALAGKYFDVLDVIEVTESSRQNFFLKLLETETKDTLYYDYNIRGSDHSFPFVVVGYFEKRQHEVIGKQFVLSSWAYTDRKYRIGARRTPKTDRLTGEKISIKAGEVWTVVGLTLNADDDYRISYELKNDRGNIIAISEWVVTNSPLIYDIDRANRIINQVGRNTFNQILTRDVQMGWHKSLVEMSVGKPRNINSTTVGNRVSEQYIFGDDLYMYFENDRLTAVQGNWMFGVPYLCYECLEN